MTVDSHAPLTVLEHVLIWDDEELIYVSRGPYASTPQRALDLAVRWWQQCTDDVIDASRVLAHGALDLALSFDDPHALRPCWPGEVPHARVWVFDIRPALAE
jgi:hypothetical protein